MSSLSGLDRGYLSVFRGCVYIYRCTCRRIDIHKYVYIYIHTHTYKYTILHTYIYIYTYKKIDARGPFWGFLQKPSLLVFLGISRACGLYPCRPGPSKGALWRISEFPKIRCLDMDPKIV